MKTKAMRKRPQLEGKLVKANLYLTDEAINFLQKIKQIQSYRSYREVFDLILTFVESEFENNIDQSLESKELLNSKISSTNLTRKSFAVNSHTLSGLKNLADSHNIKLDSLIDKTVREIIAWYLYFAKNPPFDEPQKALDAIDDVWEQIRELRFRLENTFPDLVDKNYDINSINNYMADIENAMNELYYLIKGKFAN